jgi:hypothetical protein
MKTFTFTKFFAPCALACASAFATTFPQSWENGLDGWGGGGNNYSFSTTIGVTDGSTSLVIADNTIGGFNLLSEHFSDSWRNALLSSSNPDPFVVKLDVVVTGFTPGNRIQFDLGHFGEGPGTGGQFFFGTTGTGSSILDGNLGIQAYDTNVGGQQTITFSYAPGAFTAMTPLTSYMGMQIYQSSNSTTALTFYVDNFRIEAAPIPEPSSFAALAGVMTLGLAGLRRRRARA